MDLPKSIEAYRDMADRVISWTRSDWIDERRFDELAADYLLRDARETAHYHEPETMILPFNRSSHYLAILQELVRCGLVQARKRNGLMSYRAKRD